MRQIFLEPAIVLVSKMVQNLKFGQTVNELRPFFEKSDKIWEKQDMPKMDHFFGTHCPKYHSWWPIGYINLDFKFHQISWPPSWWVFTTSWTQSVMLTGIMIHTVDNLVLTFNLIFRKMKYQVSQEHSDKYQRKMLFYLNFVFNF